MLKVAIDIERCPAEQKAQCSKLEARKESRRKKQGEKDKYAYTLCLAPYAI
jgi:hypothetical protein